MVANNTRGSWPLRRWAAVISLSLLAACGGDAADEPREPRPRPDARTPGQQAAPPAPQRDSAAPFPDGERPLRDRFSLRTGEVCSRFYAEAAPLQAELKRVGPRIQSDRGARNRAGELIDDIQAGSGEFLRRLESIPPPSSPAGRQDRTRLLASTEDLLQLQRDNVELAEELIFRPGKASDADRRRVSELRTRLGAELVEQQALLRRLDVPECLPS
jgi:hypothetical protein